jgi:hypothetical protein
MMDTGRPAYPISIVGTLKGMERSMKTVYGDTSGTLSKYKTGKSQSLPIMTATRPRATRFSAMLDTSPTMPVAAVIA